MKLFTLRKKQILPLDMDSAWEFFSNPRNLEKITPEDMSFHITRENLEDKMYPGMIVSYKIKPMPLFSFTWVTEITHVKEPEYFVDEQRFGPYAFWHHKHIFRGIDGGKSVEMEDIVDYVLPFGIFGRIAGFLFVHKKVRSIFEYREKILDEFFKK